MAINEVIIEGNLTRDGEIRQASSGLTVLNFTVAHNHRRKNPDTGEWENGDTSYIRCVMFGRQADALYSNGYFSKGRRVLVQGTLRMREYEKDGEKRTVYEVVVKEIFFGQLPNKPVSAAPAPAAPELDLYEDDLPF